MNIIRKIIKFWQEKKISNKIDKFLFILVIFLFGVVCGVIFDEIRMNKDILERSGRENMPIYPFEDQIKTGEMSDDPFQMKIYEE